MPIDFKFQSTPSAWRETLALCPEGLSVRTFQSTPSAWRETIYYNREELIFLDFNPLPPHGGRLPRLCFVPPLVISIHSLRMEGDFAYKDLYMASIISIHSLRIEGDLVEQADSVEVGISIHSLRMEGDSHIYGVRFFIFHFNPLPPHGGRLCAPLSVISGDGISIHSLRMEGDHVTIAGLPKDDIFQSTPSAWRETRFNN